MKKDRYWAEVKYVKGGWWYANKGSIDVHPEDTGALHHINVRIPRKQLVEYIKRTAK